MRQLCGLGLRHCRRGDTTLVKLPRCNVPRGIPLPSCIDGGWGVGGWKYRVINRELMLVLGMFKRASGLCALVHAYVCV